MAESKPDEVRDSVESKPTTIYYENERYQNVAGSVANESVID